jgi:putative two-component system response regulator
MNPLVLIVDDEPFGREALESVLTNQGYALDFATNGAEVLRKAGEIYPDVILLDVMMPGMNGFEVCRRLRANPITADVPIVMVTALDDRESRLMGIEVGADDFVTKPIDREELRVRVRSITRLNRYRKIVSDRVNLELTNQQLLEAYDATIEGWSRALDLRDKETEEHTLRVTEITLRLAREFGMSEEELVHIRRGALLHDIGKLGVPDGILLKNGPLDDEEWVIMRKHTLHAFDLLSPITYLKPALDIPVFHHEKWDGSGYPYGLKGDTIPLAARLFAVVDVWDALRSPRPYRPGWDETKVIEHIKSEAGSHFDPQVVAMFLILIAS